MRFKDPGDSDVHTETQGRLHLGIPDYLTFCGALCNIPSHHHIVKRCGKSRYIYSKGHILDSYTEIELQMVFNEARQIRLTFLSDRLANIQARRALLLAETAQLDAESAIVASEHCKLVNKSVPISSLPNEILAAIFDTGHRLQGHEGPRHPEFVILVSSVIRHWRNVAIDIPRLWTRINRAKFQVQTESTATYLHRSKSSPLDVTVEIGGHNGDSGEALDDVRPFVELVKPHMSRIRHLSIISASDDSLLYLLEVLRLTAAPLLQSFSISSISYSDLGLFTEPRTILADGAPSLTSVSFKEIGLQCGQPPLGLVTSMVLLLGDVDMGSSHALFCSMLSSAASLLHLEVHGDIVQQWGTESVFLPFLQTLCIKTHKLYDDGVSHQFSGLLNTITAPSLKVLSMVLFNEDDFQDLSPPSEIGDLGRFSSLSSLVLLRCFSDPSGMLPILRAFPTVTNVIYDGEPIHLLPLLREIDILKTSSPRYWPRLRSIALAHPSTSSSDIRELVNSRAAMESAISKLYLSSGASEAWGDPSLPSYAAVEVYQEEMPEELLRS